MTSTVVVTEQGDTVVVEQAATAVVEVVTRGPQGPSSIGGYGFSVSELAVNDLLAFDGAAWTNRPQIQLTDGGNF